MSKTKAGPISADRLKSFIERVERLEGERAAIGADIRDIYSEAKGVGYDVKTMRRIVQLRKKDAAERDEEEHLLDVYCHALGMVAGADTSGIGHNSPREPTEDELLEQAGKVVEEVGRCMLLPRDPLPTIRAIMDEIGCSAGKAHKLRKMVEQRVDALGLELISRSNETTVKTKNENAETAAVKQPGGDAAGTVWPAVVPAVAANPIEEVPPGGGASTVKMGHGIPDPGLGDAAIEDATGRLPGEGEENGSSSAECGCGDQLRPSGPYWRGREGRPTNDRDGEPVGDDGGEPATAPHAADGNRVDAEFVRTGSAGSNPDWPGAVGNCGALAGDAGLPPHAGEHDGLGSQPPRRDPASPERASVASSPGVGPVSTPPPGAVASESERVAAPESDLEIPAFLDRRQRVA